MLKVGVIYIFLLDNQNVAPNTKNVFYFVVNNLNISSFYKAKACFCLNILNSNVRVHFTKLLNCKTDFYKICLKSLSNKLSYN